MLGYSAEEMHGRNLFAFMDESSIEACRHNLTLRRQGTKEQHEFAFITKDGARVVTTLYASLITDTNGDFNGAVVSAEDITERKQAEELLRTLSESSPVGIYIVQEGLFQYVNPQFQKSTGYSERELLGTSSLAFMHPEDKEMVRDNAKAMLRNERAIPYEYWLIDKAGNTHWVMETANPIQYRGRRAVLEEMKTEPELSAIPVIMFTASAGLPSQDRALAMGAKSYLVKPLSAARLREAVYQAMRSVR